MKYTEFKTEFCYSGELSFFRVRGTLIWVETPESKINITQLKFELSKVKRSWSWGLNTILIRIHKSIAAYEEFWWKENFFCVF